MMMIMTMDDEYGAIDVMLRKGNRSTRRNPSALLLFPPLIPHDLTLARTLAAAIGSRRLPAELRYAIDLVLVFVIIVVVVVVVVAVVVVKVVVVVVVN
jgi:hypothetical protein